jgi:hypothetical protein
MCRDINTPKIDAALYAHHVHVQSILTTRAVVTSEKKGSLGEKGTPD